MPKALLIDPVEMRSRRMLDFKPIPINQYDRNLGDELAAGAFTKADLIRIQRDMMIIRAFEEMLDSVKKQGHFKDIPYNHRGPAHLSIGQEAAAVGQAYLLDVDDHIFGSHRSHGEILAKSLSAIHKLSDNALMSIMSNYFGGDCLRVVEKGAQGTHAGFGDRLHRLRCAGRNLRPRHRRESRLRRLDARVLSAVRCLPEQRNRGWLGRHRGWGGTLQARQSAAAAS